MSHAPPYTTDPAFKAAYSASCHCGQCTWDIAKDALSAMYCHCETCQTLHGCPFQWAAVVPKDAVQFTCDINTLVYYSAGDKALTHKLPVKISCSHCRASIADEGRNMMLLMPTYIHFPRDKDGKKVVPDAWMPSHHMFYGKRVADMNDGLDKYVTKKGEDMCDYKGRPIGKA